MMTIDDATPSATEATLRWIGDLDHPFYDDERQRFVWYEAATIGFQLMAIGHFAAVGIVLLIGGSSALPYALAILAPLVAATTAVQWYSSRHHAPYTVSSSDFRRRRGALVIVLGLIYAAGGTRVILDLAGGDSSFGGGFAVGAVPGVILGLGVVWFALRRDRLAAEAADDQDDPLH